MAIELVPLCTLRIRLREPIVLGNTPAGVRLIIEVESGAVEGDRLRGVIKGNSTADWFTIGPEGTGTLDIRALIETDDGALIFVQYLGRNDMSSSPNAPLYVAPRFETGDDRYRWLNPLLAVGKGTLDGLNLTYEFHEVR